MRDVRDRTWPLVAFTVAVQAASGLALAGFAVDLLVGPAATRSALPPGLPVLGSVLFGGACSLFHLGRRPRAWRALVNLRRSPLSREILLTGLFAGAALASVVARWGAGSRAWWAWDGLSAVLGLAAVAAAAPVYMVPARPVWNSWWVMVSFLGTILLLGGSISSRLMAGSGLREVTSALLGAGAVGAILQVASARAMTRLFSREWARAAGRGLEGRTVGWTRPRLLSLGAQLVFAGIVPVALTAAWWGSGGAGWTPGDRWLETAIVGSSLVGIVSGRWLMFELGSSIPRF